MIRKLLRLLAVLVLLLIVAVALLWVYIDHVAARALTGGVTYAGQVPCSVRSVDVSVLAGTIGVEGLSVGNPAGYDAGEMFASRRAEMDVRVRSLWDRPVHIRRLEVVGLVICIEGKDGRTNVAAFLDNVEKTIGRKDDPSSRLARVRVDRVVIRKARVQLGRGITGEGLLVMEPDDFELENLYGPDGRGVTVGELTATIVYECVSRGAEQARLNLASLIPPEVTHGIEAVTKPFGYVIKGATDLLKMPWQLLPGPRSRPAATQPGAPATTSAPADG